MENARKRISNFHLGRQIYDGAKCEVYEARYAQAGGVVQSAAVKLLKSEFACIGEELRAFLREIDWARGVRHPLFPRIMEAGEHEGHYFLAMEKLDGWTLEQLLRDLSVQQIKLPAQVTLTLVHQIADGMQRLHEHREGETPLGAVHLGIDPSNIMMRKEGTAAVIDFGETMAAGVGEAALLGESVTAYQAPERLRMLPVDLRADIYSLGKVLESMTRCMEPADLGADVPALIGRATNTHAEERFGNMRDFMDAVEVVAGNRNIEFSCHDCRRFFSEVFGASVVRTDPRANMPQVKAAPLRMASEGMATMHGLDESRAETQRSDDADRADTYPAQADRVDQDTEPAVDGTDSSVHIAATFIGGRLAEGSKDADPRVTTVEQGDLSPSPVIKKFVDEHMAVTAFAAPQTMEGLASSEESTRVSTAHIEATDVSSEQQRRKAWPQEMVETKAYSPDPETDEELAIAIERLRR